MDITDIEQRREFYAGIASCETEFNQAMSFNSRMYERIYGTHWIVKPDVFAFVKLDGKIISTASLLIADNHKVIPSENYYDLPENISSFFCHHRSKIAEFGRLTSVNVIGLKMIVEVVTKEALRRGIEYLVAWTSCKVQDRLRKECKIPIYPLEAPLNINKALQDKDWSLPPTRFFIRDDAPELVLNIPSMNGYTI